MKRTPMTVRGAEALRAELKRLKTRGPPAASSRRSPRRAPTAICPRTPSTTRRASSRASSRAASRRSRRKLANAEIIDPATLPKNGKVVFGPRWSSRTRTTAQRVTYQIVGEDEADIRAGRISVTSPIARALVGKSEGEVVDVTAPGGTRSYEIVAVKLA